MKIKSAIIISGLVSLSTLLAVAFATPEGNIDASENIQDEIPIRITNLKDENGNTPIEIQCNGIQVPKQDNILRTDCRIRNRSSKKLLAIGINYTVVSRSSSGEESGYTRLLAVIPEVDSDFSRSKLQRTFNDIPISFPSTELNPNSTIVRVEIEPVHAELKGEVIEKIGSNAESESMISDFKKGANVYRKYLKATYNKNGKSLDSITPLLEDDVSNIGGQFNFYQKAGARKYQKNFKSFYKKYGAQEAEKLLAQ
ncbi:MAG: hypothetical protein ACK5NT_01095 [Pyrinomonadaceae bacterium]